MPECGNNTIEQIEDIHPAADKYLILEKAEIAAVRSRNGYSSAFSSQAMANAVSKLILVLSNASLNASNDGREQSGSCVVARMWPRRFRKFFRYGAF